MLAGVTGDVRPAGHLGVGARLPARPHAGEKVAHVEVRGITGDARTRAGNQFLRAGFNLGVVPVSTQPVSPSNRTGHEPSGSQPSSRNTSLTPLA